LVSIKCPISEIIDGGSGYQKYKYCDKEYKVNQIVFDIIPAK